MLGPSLGLSIYSIFAIHFDDSYEEEMTCSDEITNINYNIMTSKLRNSGKKIMASFILLIILLIINIITIFIRICCQKGKDIPKPVDDKAQQLYPKSGSENRDTD